jgi:hypothetical protein
MMLGGMLDLDYGVVTSPAPIPQPPLAPEIDLRTLDWSLVVEWWKRNSEEYLCKYNDLVYNRREVCALPDDVSTFTKRSEWLDLFVLSAALSLGMRECQHKGFIRMLKNRRMGPRTLWEIYCDETILPEDWMNTLDVFIEEEEFCCEYQYWMRLFMRIYQFASHLSEYVQFVKMIDKLKPIKSFESIWNVKKNPLLSGSGIELPGLQTALCARGKAFLVRELVRRKAISNSCIFPYCFVPKGALINGEDSKSIYNRISYVLPKEDATFGGAFDIALVSYLKAERKDGIYYVF